MTDIQILTLALTMLGIFTASWFNNSRISDLSTKLDNRINDTRDVLRAEMKAMQADMNFQFERMNNKLDAILMQLAHHDARITRLEERNP